MTPTFLGSPLLVFEHISGMTRIYTFTTSGKPFEFLLSCICDNFFKRPILLIV